MSDPWAAAQGAIRAAFAVPILYTGAGLDGAGLSAIKIDEPADPYQGFNGKARRISFEIGQADLPGEPDKGDTIQQTATDGSSVGPLWRVIDIAARDDIGAWVLVVER